MESQYELRMKKIGLNIAYYRKLQSLTQEQLAEMTGLDRSHIGKIEAPNVFITFSFETLFNIADALKISPSDLLQNIN